LTDTQKVCECTSVALRKYTTQVSGPLRDRIDINILIPNIRGLNAGESSANVRERVIAARQHSIKRFIDFPWTTNSEISPASLRADFPAEPAGTDLLNSFVGSSSGLRGSHRALRVAWSLADLAGRCRPTREDVALSDLPPQFRNCTGVPVKFNSESDAFIALAHLCEPADETINKRLASGVSPNEVLDMLLTTGFPKRDHVAFGRKLEGFNLEAELDFAQKIGARVLTRDQEGWPTQLRALGTAQPWALWAIGSIDFRVIALSSVTIVGTRACTPYGAGDRHPVGGRSWDMGNECLLGRRDWN